MRPNNFAKILMLFFALALCMGSFAQEAAATAANAAPAAQASSGTSDDYLMYMMITFAVVLLITIAILGQVLIRLTLHAYDHKSKITPMVLLTAILTLAGHAALAQDAAPVVAPAAAVAHSAGVGLFSLNFIVAISLILVEVFVVVVMLIRIWALLNIIDPQPETAKRIRFELPKWFDSINDSVAVEREQDIMLDHDYDGIRELDNQLPPWWKYGFLLTIIWGIGYFTYYHVLEAAPLSAGEYENEMAAAKVAKDAYMRTAKNNVDENTIVFDKSYVAEGEKIFADNCVACHGGKGEGGVGPNLTDDYWLHGGKINDIFKSVKYGWPANGMKSWQSDFSSVQIAQVVCYVKSIRGTKPENPKAAQGDLYNEDGQAPKDAAASIAPKDTLSK